ncbi:MAG TPA: hypothetical protein DCP97_02755 [Ruminococcaceae bacterium]|nr:hypothetical protein [Oscillospiraceae bacterium]
MRINRTFSFRVAISTAAACIFAVLLFCISSIGAYAAETATQRGGMSINVKDADIRDVLSAIAINMNKSILYTGADEKITLKLDNVSAPTALDCITRLVGLTYIVEDNIVMIADSKTLAADFSKTLAVTELKLNYISADAFYTQVKGLEIPVEMVTMKTNDRKIWVRGIPQDIAKVRELLSFLDKTENADNGMIGSAVNLFKLYNLTFIDSYTAQRAIKDLKINVNTYLVGQNDIFLFGEAQPMNAALQVLGAVDIRTGTEMVPIDYSNDAQNGQANLERRKQLILDMMPELHDEDIIITEDVSRDSSQAHYIMYIDERPNVISKVKRLIQMIDDPTLGEPQKYLI